MSSAFPSLYPVQKGAAGLKDGVGSSYDTPSSPPFTSKQRNVRLQEHRKSMFQDPETRQEIAKRINLAGVSNYNKAQSILAKIFWATLIVLAFVMLIYGIIKSVNGYYYSPIATTYTINTPSSMDFPDIYICMGNALSRSFILKNPAAVAGIQYLFKSLVTKSSKRRKRNVDSVQSIENKQLADELDFLFSEEDDPGFDVLDRHVRSAPSNKETGGSLPKDEDAWKSGDVDFYQFLYEGGFDIDSTFLSCSFHSYSQKVYNCSEIVRKVIDPNYFLCYIVRVPEDQKQVKPGKGLSLILNSQVSDYPRNENDTAPNKFAGLYVSVTDRLDPTNWKKTIVSPGTFTKIDLAATSVKLINLERGSLIQPCVTNGTELYKIFNTSYSRTACQMDCLLDAYLRRCDCILLMDKSIVKRDVLDNSSFCSFNRSQTCVREKVINSTETMGKVDDCSKLCHTPCDSMRYEMRASHAKLTDNVMHNIPNYKPISANSTANELIRLDISFRRMEYAELIQAESKTIAQMLGDFGGNLNLWLGASLVALIHVFITIVATCWYFACCRS